MLKQKGKKDDNTTKTKRDTSYQSIETEKKDRLR